MKVLLNYYVKMYKSQNLRYLIVGLGAVAIDYLMYSLTFNLMGIKQSKMVGFISGACFNFTLNRKITFKKNNKLLSRLTKFSILYTVSLLLNNFTNVNCYNLLADFNFAFELSFIFSTFLSIVINFIGQKFWVFN